MANRGPKRKYEFDRAILAAQFKKIPMHAIAKQYGCSEGLIWKRLKEFGIKFEKREKRKYKPRTEEHRQNLIKALSKIDRSGPNAPNWRGGIGPINLRARSTGAFKQWKIESRKRAGNRCEGCGMPNDTMCKCCGYKIKLHCHHIKSFAEFPESRFDPQNSEVLCPKCHNSRHNGKIV